jgi:hypothetical protein
MNAENREYDQYENEVAIPAMPAQRDITNSGSQFKTRPGTKNQSDK